MILSGGRQLRVTKAHLTDAANFQCVAENKAGSDTVDFSLKVHSKWDSHCILYFEIVNFVRVCSLVGGYFQEQCLV